MTPVAPCQPSLHQFSLDEQEELAEMLDHYLLEWERGQPPSVTHWVRDRPEMEEALRLYIDQLNDLQDADLRSGGKANAICHQTTLMQPAEVRPQKCEAPFGPFGFWGLPPFRKLKVDGPLGCAARSDLLCIVSSASIKPPIRFD